MYAITGGFINSRWITFLFLSHFCNCAVYLLCSVFGALHHVFLPGTAPAAEQVLLCEEILLFIHAKLLMIKLHCKISQVLKGKNSRKKE